MALAMLFITMPELPEVETLRRELSKVLVGQVVKSVKIFWPGTIKPLSPKQFLKKIIGQKIKKLERRAKILLLSFQSSQFVLAIHLKMTGQLVYYPNHNQGSTLAGFKVEPLILGGHPEDPAKYIRAIFNFTDGSKLYFNDLRKFGWLKILSANHQQMLSERHGVEPLSKEFDLSMFKQILKRCPNRRLKQILLDQTLIAGLGNIYADESCFAAGVKPARRIKTLIKPEVEKLYRAIKRILQLAIKHGGTSTRNYVRSTGAPGGFAAYLKVYGRDGQPCKTCYTPIIKTKLAGRGTHFCPKCQK